MRLGCFYILHLSHHITVKKARSSFGCVLPLTSLRDHGVEDGANVILRDDRNGFLQSTSFQMQAEYTFGNCLYVNRVGIIFDLADGVELV